MKNKFLFSVFVYSIIFILLSLGFWQIYRLNWKLELIEQIENSLKNEPVELSNIKKKNYLINRGWIPFDKKNKSEINLIDQNNIIGTLKTQSKANFFKPENDIEKNYWFTLNREDISKFTGRNFSEYVIYLNGDYKIPKPRVITAKISNNHKKYAITWFSMAISILLIYLYFRKKNY